MEYNKIKVNPDNAPKEQEVMHEVDETKESKKIVTKAVKKKKKGLIERLVIGIIGPDGLPAVVAYLGREVVAPALKDLLVNSLKSGIDMLAYRNSGQPPVTHNTRTPVRPQTNYAANYQPSTQVAQAVSPKSMRTMVEDYMIMDRGEAVRVIQQLTAAAEKFNTVSIADYYDLIDVESKYTDFNFGWDAGLLSQAVLQPSNGGYIIKFPPVIQL